MIRSRSRCKSAGALAALRSTAVGLLWLAAVLAAPAYADTPHLQFVERTDLPALGLSLELPRDSTSFPIPSPPVYRYTVTAGSRSWKEERFSPIELWRHTETAGRWVDPTRTVMVLARIEHPPPYGFEEPHVTRDIYDAAVSNRPAPATWSGADLSRWVSAFTGEEEVLPRAVEHRPFSLKNLVAFDLQSRPDRPVFIFRLNPKAAGQQQASDRWFFTMFLLGPGLEVNAARQAVRGDFFPSVTVSSSPTPLLPSQRPEPRRIGDPVTTPRSPEFMASRGQVLDSIRNMQDWWYAETQHYLFISNLGSRHRVTVETLRDNIEMLRSAYRGLIPPIQPVTAVSVIRVFATAHEYEAYVGPRFQWTGGVWMPDRKELVIKPIERGHDRLSDRLSRVTFHEGFHQYIFYALDQTDTSIWFNEGHAVFFENASIRNGRLSIGEDEKRTRVLLEMIRKRPLNINRLLHMSDEDFYASEDAVRQENYTLAWALVYYLRKGCLVDGSQDRYASLLPGYVAAVAKTRNEARATESTFAAVDVKVLRKNLTSFWNSRNLRAAARRKRLFQP